MLARDGGEHEAPDWLDGHRGAVGKRDTHACDVGADASCEELCWRAACAERQRLASPWGIAAEHADAGGVLVEVRSNVEAVAAAARGRSEVRLSRLSAT